ncbi:MAG: glycine--tRNA ligase subunit beta, partial [Lysobacterales bacterium]
MNKNNIDTAAADLLFELGCEELPPKSLDLLARSLFEAFLEQLQKSELSFDDADSRYFYTPRRLAFRVAGLAARQPDQLLERKGPSLQAAFDSAGNPTPAAIGFARSVDREVGELDRFKTDKGEWLYCQVHKPGQSLADLLFPMLETALAKLPVAKPMRWAANDFSFIRPVHWLLAMHGDAVVEGELFGLRSNNLTRGHRIHGPGPHPVVSASDYEQVLLDARVVVDQHRRRSMIRDEVKELGRSTGGEVLLNDSLLDEVVCLVEWPRAICGSFDEEFLDVPAEALIASMQDHQKFFPVVDAQGGLAPRFIAVANLDSLDFDAVRDGFERVIRPRLADARFFWDQDKKSPLEASLAQLDNVVFQKNLGSVSDKSRRIAAISKQLAEEVDMESSAVERASLLSKCDLVSQMVVEFPELQGVMGRYYALHAGEPGEVATAIGEHYRPAFSGDDLPTTITGRIVSLADRLDSLCGIFAVGMKPTGNKDPFALRRAALGLVRILQDGEPLIALDHVLDIACRVVEKQVPVSDEARGEIRQFILERLRHYLRDAGFDTGMVNAALDAPMNTLPDLMARLEALEVFMGREEAPVLVAANKRIGNILRKATLPEQNTIEEDVFIIAEEKLLFDDIKRISLTQEKYFESGDYSAFLALLAGLSSSIEAFFDQVMVMD